MRVLLITHEDLATSPERSHRTYVGGLTDFGDVSIAVWEKMATPSLAAAASSIDRSVDDFDVCFFFVRMRLLREVDRFDWSGFGGLKVWFEEDAHINYWPGSAPLKGKFPELYRRHDFDLMIATGSKIVELLKAEGVRARWIPKGYSHLDFQDLGGERSGVCTFGRKWPSRYALAAHFRRNGVELFDANGPFPTLNERLNAHQIGVVCNMPGAFRLGRAGAYLNRFWSDDRMVRTWPAIEPMIKTFETAAAGCTLLVDRVDDLGDHGFEHGTTCLIYDDFADAVDLVRTTDPEVAAKIGRAGAELVQERHTWRHRAQQTLELLSDES